MECDDGNNLNNDGCDSTCEFEDGFKCFLSSPGGMTVCKVETQLKYSNDVFVDRQGE